MLINNNKLGFPINWNTYTLNKIGKPNVLIASKELHLNFDILQKVYKLMWQ